MVYLNSVIGIFTTVSINLLRVLLIPQQYCIYFGPSLFIFLFLATFFIGMYSNTEKRIVFLCTYNNSHVIWHIYNPLYFFEVINPTSETENL